MHAILGRLHAVETPNFYCLSFRTRLTVQKWPPDERSIMSADGTVPMPRRYCKRRELFVMIGRVVIWENEIGYSMSDFLFLKISMMEASNSNQPSYDELAVLNEGCVYIVKTNLDMETNVSYDDT
ncbi:hypothetical protein CDAR_553501 [Caerostris darwini]|uniref:Uncharacterized protein n=1 Tax=Caerostris darwini TaxID=1538125 RepID=A0AAV4T7Z5_9ARAC|nr:hypothetical protein CDAR_553501 [Caerostris darwini]